MWDGPAAAAVGSYPVATATEPSKVELLLLTTDEEEAPFEALAVAPEDPAEWMLAEALPEPPPRWLPEREDCDDCGCWFWLGLAVFELTQEPVVAD